MLDSSSEDSTPDLDTENDAAPATADTASTTDGKPAESSAAETKPAETLLDRVKALSNNRDEVSPTSEKTGTPADADTPDPKADESDDLSPEELKGLHVKTQQRFAKLKSKLDAKDTEISSLAPRAAEYDKIDTFIRNNNLSAQDVGSVLEMAVLLRSDQAAARAKLQPIMVELDRVLGETLPPELQTRVDQGYLTEEDARALARSNAAATLANRQRDAATERQRQNDTSRELREQTDSTVKAIETWETQKAARDPDWHTKRQEVAEQVELAIERKTRELKRPYFPTAEEAVKLSEDALKTIDTRFKRFNPKPKAIDPPVTSGASSRSVPAAKSTLDIVQRLSSRA